jgi:protein-S-isoprenylcysteine O-methyltransferase Ste14
LRTITWSRIPLAAVESDVMIGFLSPWLVAAVVLVLHLLVPARWVDGYVRDEQTGQPLRYRLNGLRVAVVTVALFAAAGYLGFLPWDFFWLHRWEALAGACTLGLVFTFAIVLTAPPTGRGLLADLYLGRRPNPQWGRGRVDAKMLLYMVGAILLALNVLSFAAHQRMAYPTASSPGVVLYAALFAFFVAEYLFFEEVHLYTYDFVAERVGFKLGWGCLAFYPYFYGVGLWSAASKPSPETPKLLLGAFVLVFFTGWVLSRGANLQKFLFKTRPTAKLFGVLAPESIGDSSGRLLCSGFWRLSRHINYLGEILMAIALVLVLGRPLDPWPWLYPLYYVALLLPRQADDDKRCAQKYGALWEEYCRRVPYRIIPGVY